MIHKHTLSLALSLSFVTFIFSKMSALFQSTGFFKCTIQKEDTFEKFEKIIIQRFINWKFFYADSIVSKTDIVLSSNNLTNSR